MTTPNKLITQDVERTILSALAFGNIRLDFYAKALNDALLSLLNAGHIIPVGEEYVVTDSGYMALVIKGGKGAY